MFPLGFIVYGLKPRDILCGICINPVCNCAKCRGIAYIDKCPVEGCRWSDWYSECNMFNFVPTQSRIMH